MLFIAMTEPLCESRSGTLSVFLLSGVMVMHALWQWHKKSHAPPALLVWCLVGALAAGAVLAAAIYKLDENNLNKRAERTREQFGQMHAEGIFGGRAALYHDTWRMARDQWLFGWGFNSYASVFMLYNTQTSVDNLPVFYAEAHSDWLQSMAETGLAGTVLIGLLGALPLLALRRYYCRSPLVLYPLLGCAIVLIYAWVEFPFECPAVAILFWLLFFTAVRYARLAPDNSD
jgi:O-antigen ligase